MTSNLGSDHILDNDGNDKVYEELRRTFKPEFLNRIDEIIMFKPLSKDVVYSILDNIITNIQNRLSDKRIKITLTDEAKKHIIDNSYDTEYGARPIKRYVSRNIESLIANNIIENNIQYNSTVTIDVKDDNYIIKSN